MKEIGFIFVFVFLFTSSMVIISYDRDTCNMNVTMNNGTTFKAKRVTWYKQGIADIRKCSGERIQVPTRTVKDVKFIK
jgi:hypothetical protein